MTIKTKHVAGIHVPEQDVDCHPVILDDVHDLARRVYPHVKKFDVVVQAGGNIGIFPNKLAEKFKAVYTFEPDYQNFHCLALNCQHPNVIKIQAALGKTFGFVDMEVDPRNVGANFVKGKGVIPTLRVDDLGLEDCDLLLLDIEGSEMAALLGAKKTISKFKPVIVLESKPVCSERYGGTLGDTSQWLINTFGYEIADNFNRDVLLTCKS